MGRYLERAENLARILSINETYARLDVPEDWQRIFELYGDSTRVAELEQGGTSGVLHYCLFDTSNPRSVLSCVAMARENARSVRHLVSTEMWRHLNVVHMGIKEAATKSPAPQTVYTPARETILGCQSLAGIASGTFMRSEPWYFYQVGKYIERADQTTRILDIGFGSERSADSKTARWSHINVLLRSVSGYHAYRACYPGRSRPGDAALFLLVDRSFPRAVALCVDDLTRYLEQLQALHPNVDMASISERLSALKSLIGTSHSAVNSADLLNAHLDRVQLALIELANALSERFLANDEVSGSQSQAQ